MNLPSRCSSWSLAALMLATAPLAAAPPPVVQDLRLDKHGDGEVLTFDYLSTMPENPVQHYTIYRGRLGPGFDPDFSTLGRLRHAVDPVDGTERGYTAINDDDDLDLEENYYFLVTATNAEGEGSLGQGSGGMPRGGVYGDPPLSAPELYPQSWTCVPYIGAPPPPLPPPLPLSAEATPFIYPQLCPPGLVPEPHEHLAPKGSPPADELALDAELESLTGPGPYQYWYSWAWVQPSLGFDDGSVGRLTVHSPVIDRLPQTHSLAEFASRAGFNYGDYVEVGWTVDRGVNNGSVAPHLFVFRWVNGAPGVYNAAGWVQFSNTIVPGMRLPVGTLLPAAYVNFGGNWWLFAVTANGGGWIGYFPGSLWGGTFTNLTLVQWFGEVYASGIPPNNQMGNGLRGSAQIPPVPAYIDILSTVDFATWSATFYGLPALQVTNNAYYDIYNPGPTPNGFFYYGGPGR